MDISLSDIKKIFDLNDKCDDFEIKSIVVDSRKACEGSIFAAIKGEKVDGHDFVFDLDKKFNNIAFITNKRLENISHLQIIVDDTVLSLGKIAKNYLEKLNIKKVAVTGSVGKTTTKEYIYTVLSSKFKCLKSEGNHNNELGMPLTAFELDGSYDVAVFEMGMRGFGQIDYLSDIIKPDLAAITNIGVSHIEILGSRENILKAKCEVLNNLSKSGKIVLNTDNDMLDKVKDKRVFRFSIDNKNGDLKAKDIKFFDNKTYFKVIYKDKSYDCTLNALGIHNIYNALCAISVGIIAGIDIKDAIKAFDNLKKIEMRQNIYDFNGIKLFDDSYNASPESMEAALKVLSNFKSRKIAVLSDIMELGEKSKELHQKVGKVIENSNIDIVICYGDNAKYYIENFENGKFFENFDNALKELLKVYKKDDVILFKGSRAMQLDKFLERFKTEVVK